MPTVSNVLEPRAWVEVDLGALAANYRTLRDIVDPRAAILPVVKADAYGLGMERVTRVFEGLDPAGYGVATVEEGLALRELGVARQVLVLAPVPPGLEKAAADASLTLSISDFGALARWAEAAEALPRPLDFHVEVDTGMGRCGFDWRDAAKWSPRIRERAGRQLRWTGVFTHFQGADARDASPSRAQWERFRDALAQFPPAAAGPEGEVGSGPGGLVVHACNSAAALRWPEFAGDAVRPGFFLFGGDPLAPRPPEASAPTPRPVVGVKARVLLVRDVPPGSTVGYGATHTASEWRRWATLGIGYGDGLPRSLGNRGQVLVGGRRAPIIGRISMDLTVADVSDVQTVEVGDVATLIGGDGPERITLEEVAQEAGTIGYEILTGWTSRMPRIETGHVRAI